MMYQLTKYHLYEDPRGYILSVLRTMEKEVYFYLMGAVNLKRTTLPYWLGLLRSAEPKELCSSNKVTEIYAYHP